MTRAELIARLEGYEWTDFECKKAHKDVPRDAYSTVSAFANTEGGWLLFGISEKEGNLNITGVDPASFDHVQDVFLTTLRSQQKLNQAIDAKPYVYSIDNKRILAFYIPQSSRHQKPVYLNNNPKDAYLRRGARDERINDIELQRMLRDASHFNWEEGLVYNINIEKAFDTDTLLWYTNLFYQQNPDKKKFENYLEFLQEWNFIREEEGILRPTRASILLFGLERYVRLILSRPVLDYQRIDTQFDNWDNHARWDDRMLFEENLFNTWRGLIAKYLRIAEHPFRVDPASMRRIDDPPDYIAFREASINLLIHQDYGDSHRKASLKWFTDRMQFWNSGDSFMSTVELLTKRESDLRNPMLVDAFRRIGLSDQAGSGIRAIYRNWNELGYRQPIINNEKTTKNFELILEKLKLINPFIEFIQKEDRNLNSHEILILALAQEQDYINLSDIILALNGNTNLSRQVIQSLTSLNLLEYLSKNSYCLSQDLRLNFEQTVHPQSTPQVPPMYPPSTPQVVAEINQEYSQKILQLIECFREHNELSKQDLLEILRLTDKKHFSKIYLSPSLEAGLIEMTIPDKPRSNKQKYRLTSLGTTFIKK